MPPDLIRQAARRAAPYGAGLAPPAATPPQVRAIVSPLRQGRVGLGAQIAELSPLIELVSRISGLMQQEELAPLQRQRVEAEIESARSQEEINRQQARLLGLQQQAAELELALKRDPQDRELQRQLRRLDAESKRAQIELANARARLAAIQARNETEKARHRTPQQIEAEYYSSHPEAVVSRLDPALKRADEAYKAYQQAIVSTMQTNAPVSPQAAYQLGLFVFDALPVLVQRRDPRSHELALHYWGVLDEALRTAAEQGDDQMVRLLNLYRDKLRSFMPGGVPTSEPAGPAGPAGPVGGGGSVPQSYPFETIFRPSVPLRPVPPAPSATTSSPG